MATGYPSGNHSYYFETGYYKKMIDRLVKDLEKEIHSHLTTAEESKARL